MRQTALRQILINCLKAIFAACLPIYLYYTLVIHVQIKTPSLSVLPTAENDTEAVIAHPLSFQTPDSPETCVTGSGFATDIYPFTTVTCFAGNVKSGACHVSVFHLWSRGMIFCRDGRRKTAQSFYIVTAECEMDSDLH